MHVRAFLIFSFMLAMQLSEHPGDGLVFLEARSLVATSDVQWLLPSSCVYLDPGCPAPNLVLDSRSSGASPVFAVGAPCAGVATLPGRGLLMIFPLAGVVGLSVPCLWGSCCSLCFVAGSCLPVRGELSQGLWLAPSASHLLFSWVASCK